MVIKALEGGEKIPMKNDILVNKSNQSPMAKAGRLVELGNKAKILRAELDKITEEMQPLKADLLEVTQNLGVLTLKTEKYTISRAIRITPQVEDFKTLKTSLEKANVPVMTVEAFAPQMDEVFKEALKEGKEFDGLGKRETQYITVRVNTKSEGGEEK